MDYSVGDTIEYRDFLGDRRQVRVTERHGDIKNGRPGFDGVVVGPSCGGDGPQDGQTVWGYDDQITSVATTREPQ
jgi:hypothetical protein